MKIKATREALKNKEDGREQTGQRHTGRLRKGRQARWQATVRKTERIPGRQTEGTRKAARWHASRLQGTVSRSASRLEGKAGNHACWSSKQTDKQ